MSSSKRKVTRTSSVKIPCVARTQVYTEFVPTTVFRAKTTQSLKTLVSYSTKINNITKQVVRTQVLTEFVPTTVFRAKTTQSQVTLPSKTLVRYSTKISNITQQVVRTQVLTEFVPTTVFRTKTTQRTQVLTEFVPTTVFRTNTVYRTAKPSSAKAAILSTRNVTSVITATVTKSKSGGILSAIKNIG